jgi:hypothetical protein
VSIEHAVCRLSRNGRPVGLGFAVDREHVVTCAHVVNKAHHRDDSLPPRELEQADFPDTGVSLAVDFMIGSYSATVSSSGGDRATLTASLTPAGWLPSNPARFAAEDVAVLHLSGPVPSFVPKVRTRRPRSGDAVQVFGPVAGRADGGHVVGEVLGEISNGRVQINVGGGGFRVRAGFSGGPVWRRDTGEIVGMLVACGLGDSATDAYILDTARIARVWGAWLAANTPVRSSISEREFDVDALMALNPREGGKRIARMPPDDAARLLLKAPVDAAAEAMEALLGEDEALAVSLLAHTRRNRTRELIEAMASAAEWLKDLPAAADAIEHCQDSQPDLLGENIGPLTHVKSFKRGTDGYYQSFENGQIHWTARGGAQAMTGPIAACHIVSGGSGSRLGFPLAPEMDAQQSPFTTDGKLQRFEFQRDYGPELCKSAGLTFGATVYWSDAHGAHITWGGIGGYFERLGGTSSWLGFPTSDELKAGPSRRDGPGTSGWRQRFEGGAIYYSQKTRGVAVRAHVAEYLESHGGVSNRRGFPVSPEMEAANSPYGTKGRMQRFEGAWDYPNDIVSQWSAKERPGGATLYTSETYGTCCVGWGIGIVYERLGGTSSWLGFPMSDANDARKSKNEPGRSVQEFEGGAIFWSEELHHPVPVSRTILEYLSEHDGLQERIGFPIEHEVSLEAGNSKRVQFFEHGLVTVRNGAIETWLRPDDLGNA